MSMFAAGMSFTSAVISAGVFGWYGHAAVMMTMFVVNAYFAYLTRQI